MNVTSFQTVGQVLQILVTRPGYGPGVLHGGNGVVLQQNELVVPGRDYFFVSQSHFSGRLRNQGLRDLGDPGCCTVKPELAKPPVFCCRRSETRKITLSAD